VPSEHHCVGAVPKALLSIRFYIGTKQQLVSDF